MPIEQPRNKVVLTIAGHDPSGGAGIQADIESIAAQGCRPVSLITALTAQNTQAFKTLIPQTPEQFRHQYRMLLDDIKVDACKIGLIGDLVIAHIISEILERLHVPVVLDPILRTGTGDAVSDTALRDFIVQHLLRRSTVLTPNCAEARELTGCNDIYQAGAQLVTGGCPHVLITGADAATEQVINILFEPHANPVAYQWQRLPGTYHGSGCTLSAAIAARLALGSTVKDAITAAQEFTWKSLQHGMQLGRGQMHPNRFYHD